MIFIWNDNKILSPYTHNKNNNNNNKETQNITNSKHIKISQLI